MLLTHYTHSIYPPKTVDGFIWFFFTIPPCSALAIFPFFAINSEEYLLSNCPHSKILLSNIISQRISIEVPPSDNTSHVIGNDYIYISVLLLQSLTKLNSVPFTVASTFESRITPLTSLQQEVEGIQFEVTKAILTD